MKFVVMNRSPTRDRRMFACMALKSANVQDQNRDASRWWCGFAYRGLRETGI